jgi:type I restriction enzyme S subunit
MMDSKEYITDEGAELCKVVPKNTLIVSFKLSLGRLAITGCDLFTNEAIAALYINEDVELEQDYLYWYLTFFDWDAAAGSDIKVKGKTLNKAKLKEIIVPIPSIPEQKRIVALLDTVFADLEQTRAKTEQNLKNARELFDSYLQQVFSQKGDGWEELPLENLVSEDCSLSYGIVQPGDDFNDGLPVVRPTDLKVELITQDGLKLIDPVKSESYKKTVLQGGELLVCVRGSTGITSIASNSLAGANVTRGIVPVRFNPELISGRFGYYQFISPLVQSQVKDATYGAALMQINIRDFRKIKISTPSIAVQKALVNKLDSIRPDLIRAEEIYKQKLLALDELKKSILQKAFSGELTTNVE